MKINKILLLVLIFPICLSVQAQKLFSKIIPDSSGVLFVNSILESKDLNVFIYEYLYNGGGVAVGDLNNDGLPDLYFNGNMVTNKLYLNLGNFKFKDVTESAGVLGGIGFKTGVTFVDINADGFLDIYVCKSALADPSLRKNILYINNGNLTFTDRAHEYGLDDASYSTQAYFYDMDLDGDLDLFLLNHPFNMREANSIKLKYNASGKLVAEKDTLRKYVSSRYYENINNHFKDKTIAAGLGTYSFGLSAIIDDFNEDGFPDIYSCNDYHQPDYLFINKKNGTFTNRSENYFNHFSYSSMGSDYADINNDGFLDLIVLDMLPESIQRQKQLRGPSNYDYFNKRINYGFGYQYMKNVLQLNNGNESYSDISYLAGVAFTDWSWAPLVADFDNDGNKDLYITNGYLRDETDMDFMTFMADSIKKELLKTSTTGDAMKLLDNMPSNKLYNYFFRNSGNLTFKDITTTCGLNTPSFSNGAVYADLDNDGDLDLVVNNINDAAFIFKNNSTENKAGNYIRFKLKGSSKNPDGIGAIIQIETEDGKKQIQHYMPEKGYLSSHERFVHFGIGFNKIASVAVTWPNKKAQVLTGLSVNQRYILDIDNALSIPEKAVSTPSLFKEITKETGVSLIQKENSYIDFKLEPLLPHQFSKLGPCVSVADINGDSYEDFFIGGSKDNESIIYVQDSSGKFSKSIQLNLSADRKFEDIGAEFFDADYDGDQDLLVVSGGNEYPEKDSLYPVRLYINDGKGKFNKSNVLGKFFTSGKAIAIDDFNKDGYKDIFIGGRIVPGHYGLLPKSFLLQNNNGTFTDITSGVPDLATIGMVTDAIWSDMDGDGWKELILVGEWMPVTIFKNQNGVLSNMATSITNSNGWWNTIQSLDIDGDGDLDLVGGNIGLNTRYKCNDKSPLTMLVNDFDKNGSTDCIISMYQVDGKSYPLALRDQVLDQMNFLKKKFLRYKDYANATVNEFFTPEQLADAQTFKSMTMASSIFLNDGNGNFTEKFLPRKAQISPVNTILLDDFDGDGKKDLLVAGNDYSSEVETGRNDAGIGLLLKSTGTDKFLPVPVTQGGCYIPGDVKCLKKIMIHNKSCIIVGRNQGDLQFLSFDQK